MDNITFPSETRYSYCDVPYGAHRIIVQAVGVNRRVLDIGCSSGYLAQAFKNHGCTVTGIECDPQCARSAQDICDQLIVGDVEEVLEKASFPRGGFDVIVCADVLEHLRRPDIILRKLGAYLKPGGRIIASIPNLGRVDMRIKLLFGRFDYQETGIMDKTHLRFFTLRSAQGLFRESGYRVLSVRATGLAARLSLLKSVLAFQFVIEAVKA